jgi:hypothetical protein
MTVSAGQITFQQMPIQWYANLCEPHRQNFAIDDSNHSTSIHFMIIYNSKLWLASVVRYSTYSTALDEDKKVLEIIKAFCVRGDDMHAYANCRQLIGYGISGNLSVIVSTMKLSSL